VMKDEEEESEEESEEGALLEGLELEQQPVTEDRRLEPEVDDDDDNDDDEEHADAHVTAPAIASTAQPSDSPAGARNVIEADLAPEGGAEELFSSIPAPPAPEVRALPVDDLADGGDSDMEESDDVALSRIGADGERSQVCATDNLLGGIDESVESVAAAAASSDSNRDVSMPVACDSAATPDRRDNGIDASASRDNGIYGTTSPRPETPSWLRDAETLLGRQPQLSSDALVEAAAPAANSAFAFTHGSPPEAFEMPEEERGAEADLRPPADMSSLSSMPAIGMTTEEIDAEPEEAHDLKDIGGSPPPVDDFLQTELTPEEAPESSEQEALPAIIDGAVVAAFPGSAPTAASCVEAEAQPVPEASERARLQKQLEEMEDLMQAAVDNDDFEEASRLQEVVDDLTDKLSALG